MYDLMHFMHFAADARFQNTGLERSEPLHQDIEWMQEKYSLPAPQIKEDGPGETYAKCVLAPPDKCSRAHELQLSVLSTLFLLQSCVAFSCLQCQLPLAWKR